MNSPKSNFQMSHSLESKEESNMSMKDMKLSVKQLMAPKIVKEASRTVIVHAAEKSDVHLREDMQKPAEMMRIHSAKRVNITNKGTLEMDDESRLSIATEKFNFDEMVRIGRPERDNTLKVPLMRSLQALRKYKMGTSPAVKTGLLRTTLGASIADPANEQTKRLLADLTATGRPGSPLLSGNLANMPGNLADVSFTDEATEPSNNLQHAKSAPNLRNKSANKEIAVKTGNSVNMYLYHLSSQGRRNVKSQSEKLARATSPDLTANSIDDSTFASNNGRDAGAGADAANDIVLDEGPAESQLPAMYDPATVRLPRMELVPGFGSTTPLVESKLGAYRVHSSKAITAAAALEEASVYEVDSASRGGDDSYRAERMESFYKSAETSVLLANSLADTVERYNQDQLDAALAEQQREAAKLRAESGGSVHSSQEGSSVRSIVHVPASAPPSPQRRGLHCTKCFTTANMWCAQCAAAYCSVCWGQVLHHDLRQMSPLKSARARPQTEGVVSSNAGSVHSVGRSPVKNSYSKSILFQPFLPNTVSGNNNANTNEGKYGSACAAKIPLPDYVITQYDQYPAPPVFIDGKGHVHEDTIKQRPYTAPILTQQELHQLQMTNHFKRASQQDQYKQMLLLKYKANTIGAPRSEGGGSSSTAFDGVTSGIHYEAVDPLPMTHSKGKVVVRKNKKKFAKLRPVSSSANADGTLSVGYGLKPRITSKPLVGILRDGTPEDWKTALFAANDIGKDTSNAVRRSSSGDGRGIASK